MSIGQLVLAAALATAQHQHQGSARPQSADLVRCALAQPAVERTVDAAMQRLELARQSNDAAAMRAAVEDFERVVKELRAQLAPCTALGTSADPHAGHATPSTTPSAADPHAGHGAATPAPAAGRAPRAAKPADPHAGHAAPDARKPAPRPPAAAPPQKAGETQDPVCGQTVDPEKALTATYKGRTYYFCSAEDRLRFIRNPETYLQKKSGEP